MTTTRPDFAQIVKRKRARVRDLLTMIEILNGPKTTENIHKTRLITQLRALITDSEQE